MQMKSNKNLFAVFKTHVLSSDAVVNRALDEIVTKKTLTASYVKSHFSELVVNVQDKAYAIFLDSQREAWSKSIEAYLQRELGNPTTRAEVTNLLSEKFNEFDSFFVSLGNSRRNRAGVAFQITIRELFKKLNYPFTEEPIIDGQPDFLLPSIEYFKKNPIDCIIFTVKRTLRERWRQIVTEGTRGLGFFLATIDDSISAPQLLEMSKNRIYLVVPEELKESQDLYAKAVNVLTFEQFFENHVDPGLKRWKQSRAFP
jgi:hypothetical protein